jgi:hypothetical protein
MIKKDKEYNLKEIRDGKLIPWALHYQTIRKIIEGSSLLANVKGVERQRRYTIKGSEIIRYKKQYLIALAKK